ncbi:MAG: pantoate--beta-alanine ligase [Firmicutes bacterium]|nr:pantoate--beta-alanine ligase [Bacillota bacterium]MBQ4595551.1 pantoate--beta-alanine ligase [Bacillota bacterium]
MKLIIAETKKEAREQVKEWHRQGLTVGLVPTMGALHEGHASLVDAAAKECDRVVASIFVNPTQFAANEDLDKYPRDFDRDCRILEGHGCHMVFHPEVAEMYPDEFCAAVDIESEMTKQLCGKSRATHFKGVCTVVSKLFNIVGADKAYFGEKDAQQLAVIKTMARDLDMDIEIVGCPTVREEDGLARSSRNTYLNADERKAAGVLYKGIVAAKDKIDRVPQGGIATAESILEVMRDVINTEPLAKIEYIEAVDGMTLLPVDEIKKGVLIAMAVHIGNTRLIDNFTV